MSRRHRATVRRALLCATVSSFVLALAASCRKDREPAATTAPTTPTTPTSTGQPPPAASTTNPHGVAPSSPHGAAPATAGDIIATGPVAETMTSGGYTYVRVDTADGPLWAAAPEFPIAVGDHVAVPSGSLMTNFHSKTLERTFAQVYFVPAIHKQGGGPAAGAAAATTAPPANPHGSLATTAPADTGAVIAKVEGGHTIAEVFAKRAELAGTQVKVRGRVVKVNNGIMGANWLHIQDGSGEPGTDDLTATTQTTVDVGTVVVVSGTLVVDKDFGAGYTYTAIVENATVTAQ